MASPVRSPKSRGGKPCVFCFENTVNDELYGKLLTKAGITAHYFCMLFASGLSQNGKSEKQGILGFLPADIQKEVRRASRLRCSYCRKSGATIGCVTKNCKKSFHLSCGRMNYTLHQFFDTFCSYCPIHRPVQEVPALNDTDVTCSICMSHVTPAPTIGTLQAPCCSKYWYHRDCIQRYSNSAGLYFFKCPLCNNKDEFQQTMLTFGIYIPDQDASWETEPHAFQDLLERYRNCDASSCKCVEGRKYDEEGTKWEISVCEYCGSQGSHLACNYLVKIRKKSVCPSCYEVEKKVAEENKMKSPIRTPKSPNLDDGLSPDQKQTGSNYPGPSYKLKKKGLPRQDQTSLDIPTLSPHNAQRMRMPSKTRTATETKRRGKRLSMASPERKTSIAKKQKIKCETQTYSMLEGQSQSSNCEDKENASFKQKMQKKSQRTSKSPLMRPSGQKRGNRRRLTPENDKSQTSITHWFKSQSENGKNLSIDSSPTKTSVIKWFKRNSTALDNLCSKDIPESVNYQTNKTGGGKSPVKTRSPVKASSIYSSPTKRRRQIRTVEWKGKQLVIKSPRVMLRKDFNLCKLKPRQLIIDMNDRKGAASDSDKDLLNIINTDVRLTRNMLHDASTSTTASITSTRSANFVSSSCTQTIRDTTDENSGTSDKSFTKGINSISTQTHIYKSEKSNKVAVDTKSIDIDGKVRRKSSMGTRWKGREDRMLNSICKNTDTNESLPEMKCKSRSLDEKQINPTKKERKDSLNMRRELPKSTSRSRSLKDDSARKVKSHHQADIQTELNDSPSKNLRKCNSELLQCADKNQNTPKRQEASADNETNLLSKQMYKEHENSPAKNLRKRVSGLSTPVEKCHQIDGQQIYSIDVDDQTSGATTDDLQPVCSSLDTNTTNTGTFSFFKQTDSKSPINSQRHSSRLKAKSTEKFPQETKDSGSELNCGLQLVQAMEREAEGELGHTSGAQTDISTSHEKLNRFKKYMSKQISAKQKKTSPHQDRIDRIRKYIYPSHGRRSLPANFSKQQRSSTKKVQRYRSPKTRTQKKEALALEGFQCDEELENVAENPSQRLRRSPRKLGKADNFTSLQATTNQDQICLQQNLDPEKNNFLMPLSQLTHEFNNVANKQRKHSCVPSSGYQNNNYVTWTLPGTLQIGSEKYYSDINENMEDLLNNVKHKTASLDALRPEIDSWDRARRNRNLPIKKQQYMGGNMDIRKEVDTLLENNLSLFHSQSDSCMQSNSGGSDTSSNSEVCSTALSLSPSYVTRFRRSHSRTDRDVQNISTSLIKNLSDFPDENAFIDKKGKSATKFDLASDVQVMADYYSSEPAPSGRLNTNSLSSDDFDIISIN